MKFLLLVETLPWTGPSQRTGGEKSPVVPVPAKAISYLLLSDGELDQMHQCLPAEATSLGIPTDRFHLATSVIQVCTHTRPSRSHTSAHTLHIPAENAHLTLIEELSSC